MYIVCNWVDTCTGDRGVDVLGPYTEEEARACALRLLTRRQDDVQMTLDAHLEKPTVRSELQQPPLFDEDTWTSPRDVVYHAGIMAGVFAPANLVQSRVAV